MIHSRSIGLFLGMVVFLNAQTSGLPQKHITPLRHHVDPANTYHRVICIVPYVGSGTHGDPKRPLYAPLPVPDPAAPLPSLLSGSDRSGIIAYKHLPSDDKSVALVEYVAVNRAALLPILNDKTIISFEKGKHTRAEMETACKKFRKDFVLENLGVPVR
jgi:hypothetical protein